MRRGRILSDPLRTPDARRLNEDMPMLDTPTKPFPTMRSGVRPCPPASASGI